MIGRDRRPVGAQEAAAGRCRLHRRRRHHRDALPHRRPLPARRGAVPGRQHRLRRQRRGLQLVPAAARRPGRPRQGLQPRLGASATSAAACCWRSTWSRSPCSARTATRSAPWTWPAGRIVSAGVWWAVFTLVPLRWLREPPQRRGRAPAAATCSPTGSGSSAAPCARCKAYPLTLFFLLAFLVYNDGIQTVIALASQYGTEELRLEQTHPDRRRSCWCSSSPSAARCCSGALARRIGAWKTVLVSLVLWTGGDHRRVLAAGRGAAAVHDARRGDRHGARRQPGAEPVAVQPAHPGRQGGRVLRLLRDQRQGHQLARAAAVRPGVPAHRTATGWPSSRCWSSSWSASLLLLAVPMRRAIVAAGNTPPRVL